MMGADPTPEDLAALLHLRCSTPELERLTLALHRHALTGSRAGREGFAKGTFFLALQITSDAELAQDCAIVAFRRFEAFSAGSLVAWVRAIVRNLRRQRWDAEQRARSRFVSLDTEPESRSAHFELDASDDVRAVRRAAQRLTPRLREVVELRLAGLSTDDIAARLCITPDTVRATQSRAVRELGRALRGGGA